MKRWLRRLAVVLLALAAAAALLVVGALAFLDSDSGQRFLTQQALAAARDALAGRLEVKQVELRGSRLVLEGLALYTPEGELVAEVARAEAMVQRSRLLGGTLALDDVQVRGPRLYLVQDERGLNLARAVAAKRAATGGGGGGGGRAFTVLVSSLRLTGGFVDVRLPERRVTVDGLVADGKAALVTSPLSLDAALEASARMTAPLDAPLAVQLAVKPRAPGTLDADGFVSLDDSRLQAALAWPALEAKLTRVEAGPKTVTAFVPAWPVRVPVLVDGTASPRAAALRVRAGKAEATVSAKWNPDAGAVEAFALAARDVDLSELLDGGRPSRLTLTAKGAAPDTTLDGLTGTLEAQGSWQTPEGRTLASLDARARAAGGKLEVKRLAASAPGVDVSVTGSGTTKRVALSGVLEARDLSRLAGAVADFTGTPRVDLAGHGRLDVGVQGPLAGPALSVKGRLETLRAPGFSVERLEVDAQLPDVRHPLDTDGQLSAQRLRVGDRAFDEVRAKATTHGREVDGELSMRGLGDLVVHLGGTLDKDRKGLAVTTLGVVSPEAEWALEAPTHLAWAAPRVEVAPLALRSGDQRLYVEAKKAGPRLDASLTLERVRLDRLPRVLAPPELKLGGAVSGRVRASGRLPRPEVEATVEWRGGAVRGFTALELTAAGAYRQRRAAGKLTVVAPLGRASGDFEVPVDALLAGRPEPWRAHLDVADVDATQLGRALGERLPVEGVVALAADLGGTTAAPTLRLEATSPQLTLHLEREEEGATRGARTGRVTEVAAEAGALERLVLRAVKLVVSTREPDATPLPGAAPPSGPTPGPAPTQPPGPTPPPATATPSDTGPRAPFATAGALSLEASASALGGTATVTLETPLTLPGLRTHLPTAVEARALPLRAHATARGLDLKALHQLGLVEDDTLSGAVGLEASAEGSADAPLVKATLELGQVHLAPFDGLDATVTLQTTTDRTALVAKATLQGKQALSVDAALDAPLAHLRNPEAAGGRPLRIDGTLYPLDLAALLPKGEARDAQPAGTASLTLTVGGTADAPVIDLKGSVQRLQFSRVALGSARFEWKGRGPKQALTLALGGQGRDDLKVKGDVGLELSLPALRKGLDVDAAPVALHLEAKELDLGFLSGVTETLRIVGGRLTMAGDVDGTVGAPRFKGTAEWAKGRLGLMGYGDYRDIELALSASNDEAAVSKLRVKSGGGLLSLKAHAARTLGEVWSLEVDGNTDRFPLVVDDQLAATVSLKLAARGDITPAMVDLKSLSLPRVEVELPEVSGKDVQSLERPADVIVLRGGQAVTKKRRQQARDEAATAGAAPSRTYRATIDAPRNVWVKSSDVNLELGLSEDFKVESAGQALVSGEAHILRGRLDVIGRTFEVQKGSSARFAGPAKEPYVNATALHVNEKEKVRVTVTVVGKGKDLKLTTTSEPPMPESDIYTLLATGRTSLRLGSGASITAEQAVSVLGSLAASQLKNVLAKKVPIDVLSIDTGAEGIQSLRVEVGKYLTDRLYLGYTGQVGANPRQGENPHAGRLEFQMSRQWSLEGYAGTAPAAGADVVWSTDF